MGPPLGGWLFSVGGFTLPFLLLGFGLLPAAALIYHNLPLVRPSTSKDGDDEVKADDVPMRTLIRNPQVHRRECARSHVRVHRLGVLDQGK